MWHAMDSNTRLVLATQTCTEVLWAAAAVRRGDRGECIPATTTGFSTHWHGRHVHGYTAVRAIHWLCVLWRIARTHRHKVGLRVVSGWCRRRGGSSSPALFGIMS